MKLKSFLLILTLLNAFGLIAQKVNQSNDFNVSLSKPYKVIDAEKKWYMNSDDYVVTLKITKRRDVYVQSFDAKTLTQVAVNYYKDFDRNVVFNHFAELDGKFYMFYSLWDRGAELEQLFVREVNPETAKFKGEGKKLIEVKGKIAGSLNNRGWYSFEVVDKFQYQRSGKEDKILIHYRLKPEFKDDSRSYDQIGLHVFDRNLDEQWSKVVEMPYTEEKMDFYDYSINSDGDVYILSKVYNDESTDDRKSKRDDNPNYHMELFLVDSRTHKVKKEEITLEDKFIRSVLLYESNEDYMVMGGYYADPETKYGAKGVFVFKVNKDGSLYDKYFHEIPLGILNQNASRGEVRRNTRDEEKGKSAFQHLVLDRIVTTEDGSVILIGEEYQVISHTHINANGVANTYYTYHYNDILMTRISSTGSLAWMHKIPKKQTGRRGKGGMSYEYLGDANSHYVLYLDNIKNLNLEKDDVPRGHSDGAGGFLTSSKIDHGSGGSSKESLFDLRDVKGIKAYQFDTGRIVQLSDQEIAVEVYKKRKEDVWVRVALQ